MGGFLIFIVIAYLLATPIYCYNLAKEKGYDPVGALIQGIFLGFIALLYHLGLPDKTLNRGLKYWEMNQNDKLDGLCLDVRQLIRNLDSKQTMQENE
jgi:hypothetical protein